MQSYGIGSVPISPFLMTPQKSADREKQYFNFHQLSTVPLKTPTPDEVRDTQKLWDSCKDLRVPNSVVSYSRFHYPYGSLTPAKFIHHYSPKPERTESKEDRQDQVSPKVVDIPSMEPTPSSNKKTFLKLQIEHSGEEIIPEEDVVLNYSPPSPMHQQSHELRALTFACTQPAHFDSHGLVQPTQQRIKRTGELELPFSDAERVHQHLEQPKEDELGAIEWSLAAGRCAQRKTAQGPFLVLGEVLPVCILGHTAGSGLVDVADITEVVPHCQYQLLTNSDLDYKYRIPQEHFVMTAPSISQLSSVRGENAYAKMENSDGISPVSLVMHKVDKNSRTLPFQPRLPEALPLCYARSIVIMLMSNSHSSDCVDSIGVCYQRSNHAVKYACHADHMKELPLGQPTFTDIELDNKNGCVYVTTQRKGSRRTQQDAHAAVPVIPCSTRYAGTYAVADGHGLEGHALSSAVVKEQTSKLSKLKLQREGECGRPALGMDHSIMLMYNAFKAVLNPAFAVQHHGNSAGCVAVAAYINGRERFVSIGYVGDTRAALIRQGKVVYTTYDHIADNSTEACQLKLQGADLISTAGGMRVNGVLQQSRSIGDTKYKLVRHCRLETWNFRPGDLLLLASDGAWSGSSGCACDDLSTAVCVCVCENSIATDDKYCIMCKNMICSYCTDTIYMHDTVYGSIIPDYATVIANEKALKSKLGRSGYHLTHLAAHKAVQLAQRKIENSQNTPCQRGRPVGEDQNWVIQPITSVKRQHSVCVEKATPRNRQHAWQPMNQFGLSTVEEGDEERDDSCCTHQSVYDFPSPKQHVASADHCEVSACPISISKYLAQNTANATGSDNVTVTCIVLDQYQE